MIEYILYTFISFFLYISIILYITQLTKKLFFSKQKSVEKIKN